MHLVHGHARRRPHRSWHRPRHPSRHQPHQRLRRLPQHLITNAALEGFTWAFFKAFAYGLRNTSVAARTFDDILPTPKVSSTKLQNLINNLYKGTTNPNRIGNGTTMDAIRHELATGVPTAGRMHTIKGQETLNGLRNWLQRNKDADYYDRLVAQSFAHELSLVLRGLG